MASIFKKSQLSAFQEIQLRPAIRNDLAELKKQRKQIEVAAGNCGNCSHGKRKKLSIHCSRKNKFVQSYNYCEKYSHGK